MRSLGLGAWGAAIRGWEEGFVMKTCSAVLFITEKTGNNPSGRPLGPAGSYSEGTEMPGSDELRAPWRQSACVGGAKYNVVCTQRVITGQRGSGVCRHPTLLHPPRRLGEVGAPAGRGRSQPPGPPQPASGLCSPRKGSK